MPKRHKMTKKASKKQFTKGAVKVHPKNVRAHVLRGGIRL